MSRGREVRRQWLVWSTRCMDSGEEQLIFCCSVSNYTVLIESCLRDWKEQKKLKRSEDRLTVLLAEMACG